MDSFNCGLFCLSVLIENHECTNSFSYFNRNSAAALIVFDVTDLQSFEKSQTWVTELNEKAPANIVLTLVGNKIDLESRQVSREDAEEYARSLGLRYFEVSAKANIGIDDLFTEVAKALPRESVNKRRSNLHLKKNELQKDEGSCSGC